MKHASRVLTLVAIIGVTVFAGAAVARIQVHRATRSEARTINLAANVQHSCGFDARVNYLSSIHVTSNGWAAGTIKAYNPMLQGDCKLLLRFFHRWRVVAYGSTFRGAHAPKAVLRALGLIP